MSDLNRRQLIVTAAVTAAAAACCACELAQAAEAEGGEHRGGESRPAPTTGPAFAKGPVDVGPKSAYSKDGVTDKFAKTNRVLVIRHEGKIYAPTATCTHKNCAVKLKGEDIVCPCHGSKYSLQGTSIKGPAKGSLYRYGISVNDAGHIIVDKSKQFEEKDWDKEGASITV